MKKYLLLCLALSALFVPAIAHADVTLTADQKSGTSLLTVDLKFNGVESSNALAGTLTSTLGGGPHFDTYCVDLYHDFYVNTNPVSSWQVNVLPIQTLTETPIGGNGAGVGYLYDTYASAVTSDVQGSGLQIAIWKVVYDNGGALETGNFQFADSGPVGGTQDLVYQQAKAYLSTYNGTQSGQASWLAATSHPNNFNQDLVGPAVPEPSTLAVFGIGGLGLVWFAKRRRSA
jgi:hypothetical protein